VPAQIHTAGDDAVRSTLAAHSGYLTRACASSRAGWVFVGRPVQAAGSGPISWAINDDVVAADEPWFGCTAIEQALGKRWSDAACGAQQPAWQPLTGSGYGVPAEGAHYECNESVV
jgi:hypothetical protein